MSPEVSFWVCHIFCTKPEAVWEGVSQLLEMTWVRKMEWEMGQKLTTTVSPGGPEVLRPLRPLLASQVPLFGYLLP